MSEIAREDSFHMDDYFLYPLLSILDGWKIKIIGASVLAFFLIALEFLLGSLDSATLQGIAILILLDWMTGISVAFAKKAVSSQKAFAGMVKTLILIGFCAVGYQIAFRIEPLILGWIDNVFFSYVAFTEAVSILENLDKLAEAYGINLPILRKASAYLKARGDEVFKKCTIITKDGAGKQFICFKCHKPGADRVVEGQILCEECKESSKTPKEDL